jgi:hypothetical protein
LVNAFAYLDLVWHDTPFNDRALSDSLSKLMHSVEMPDRFRRVEMFLSYLEKKELKELELQPAAKAAFGGALMPEIWRQYHLDKNHIMERVFGPPRHGRSSRRTSHYPTRRNRR